MDFETSYGHLIRSLSKVIREEDAEKIVDKAISMARLPKKAKYDADEFIRICEELKKNSKGLKEHGRYVAIVASGSASQAHASKSMKRLSF